MNAMCAARALPDAAGSDGCAACCGMSGRPSQWLSLNSSTTVPTGWSGTQRYGDRRREPERWRSASWTTRRGARSLLHRGRTRVTRWKPPSGISVVWVGTDGRGGGPLLLTGTGLRVSVHATFLLCLPSEAHRGEGLGIPSPLLGCLSGNLVRWLRISRTYSSGFFRVSSVLCACLAR